MENSVKADRFVGHLIWALIGSQKVSCALISIQYFGATVSNGFLKKMNENPLVSLQNITKSFGSLTALDGVCLNIYSGQVLALVGDNGAGKSTLIKILSGAHAQTSGSLLVNGKETLLDSPRKATDVGVATIYQELAIANNLTVIENVFLGREITKNYFGIPVMQSDKMRECVTKLMDEIEATIDDLDAMVGALSGGQRQAVAICRALHLSAKLVIMDEPTAALAVAETEKVLKIIKRLANQETAVILISHNIQNVFEVADRICVLRQGKMIAELTKTETSPEEVVGYITGAHESLRAEKLM